MFHERDKRMGCQAQRARVEEWLAGSGSSTDPGPALTAHLQQCPKCREAFDTALLARRIVRNACEPVEPSGAFVTRVMATIREEEARRAAAGALWQPIELLASRFALVAAVLLLVASIYLAEFAPPFQMPVTGSQTEMVGLMPEPPAQPANQDEVLMSLVDSGNGN
jgi:predicted anti-sigma-YlaC factor YlaD